MKFRVHNCNRLSVIYHPMPAPLLMNHGRGFASLSFMKKLRNIRPRASTNGGPGSSPGDSFLVPGATVAAVFMLGALHARRLYNDKKADEAREKKIELEFQPDIKEIPVWLRPYIYRAWARALHSNLEEVALPLEDYASLRDFFVRTLKEGTRPVDPDPQCLVSPVDGIVLRFGELKGVGAMIEQVKGFSYSVSSLLGASSLLPLVADEATYRDKNEPQNNSKHKHKKSWWSISLASPKVWHPTAARPMCGLFYCVIYLKPGDYHRIHSPIDWNVLVRRHFHGQLYHVNERATRTIRNLYIENERVILEGLWQEGYIALAAVGATNIGSIELSIEPELRTNRPKKLFLQSEPLEERVYEPEGVGRMLRKGDEVAAFNMGSTVVLVFQAPTSRPGKQDDSSQAFKFNVRSGDSIRVGEALGRWQNS